MRYTLKRAAELAEASYVGKSAPVIKKQFKAELDEDDVQAILLKDNTLLIPGSNSINDYIRYNFRVRGMFRRKQLKMATHVGTAPVTWHQGFLAHAKVVQDWLLRKKYKPTFIIGHSLGAASAQILSAGYGIPAIGFAAPRPSRTASSRAAADKCLLVNRTDDNVCTLPGGFHHLGDVRAIKPRAPNFGMDHNMGHYRRAVNEGILARKVPDRWPN